MLPYLTHAAQADRCCAAPGCWASLGWSLTPLQDSQPVLDPWEGEKLPSASEDTEAAAGCCESFVHCLAFNPSNLMGTEFLSHLPEK